MARTAYRTVSLDEAADEIAALTRGFLGRCVKA